MKYRTTPEAYDLLHAGALALSEIEANGVRVDQPYLKSALALTARQIRELEEVLRADPVYKVWRRRFGEKTKLTAPQQLSDVIFKELGYKRKSAGSGRGGERAEGSRRGEAEEAAFEGIDLPFLKTYFKAQKIRKGRGTYLRGIEREMVLHADGCYYVHPSYNLNTVATFRSSCDNPNWQNIPSRIDWLAAMIRRSYIPRPGFQLIEIDYSQIEVRVAACYNHDREMIRYINDPKSDMHRDMAAKLFFLTGKQGEQKDIRHLAKNKMVFPQFYGDFYIRCARHIWDAIGFQGIKLDGVSLYEHLAKHGIKELGACDPGERARPGTFEAHVKEIERWMWEDWFREYAQWKRDYYAAYQRTGGFQMHTGFAVNGTYAKNDVTNYPVQGSAFHCLLWSLPRINRRLQRYKMRSRVVGQIHDCVVGDVHPRERDDYIHLVREVMVDEVAKAWKWLIVPLEVEPEVCPVDGPWSGKMASVLDPESDRWVPKDRKKWEEKYGDWSLQLKG